MNNRPVIIKLGGSAITNKNEFKSPKLDVIHQLSEEIGRIYREVEKRLIIIHGGGSFGHPIASKFQLHEGLKKENSIFGVSETIDAMRELSLIISKHLRANGVPVVPIQPSAIALNKASKLHSIHLETIIKFLELDMTPLLWGDVVYDLEQGVSILSGDELVSKLAIELEAKMVIYGSDVDGIYRDPKNKIGLIKYVNKQNLNEILAYISGSSGIDVTGGMKRKFEEILKMFNKGIPIFLVNATKKNQIYETIKNRKIMGTLFYRDRDKE